MTDEEISARELAGYLRSIDSRLANIEQSIGRIERELSNVQKEKYEGKKRFKSRQKTARQPGENKRPAAPRFKRSKYRPKP